MSRFIFLAIDLEEKRKKLLGPCPAQLDLRLMCSKQKDTLTINGCSMKQTKCGSPWQKLLRSEVDDSWETIVLLADSCCFLLPYCPERLWLHSNPSSWIPSLRCQTPTYTLENKQNMTSLFLSLESTSEPFNTGGQTIGSINWSWSVTKSITYKNL